MSLTVRKDVNDWFVGGETSESALAAGTRVSAQIKLDVDKLKMMLVRDVGEQRGSRSGLTRLPQFA